MSDEWRLENILNWSTKKFPRAYFVLLLWDHLDFIHNEEWSIDYIKLDKVFILDGLSNSCTVFPMSLVTYYFHCLFYICFNCDVTGQVQKYYFCDDFIRLMHERGLGYIQFSLCPSLRINSTFSFIHLSTIMSLFM